MENLTDNSYYGSIHNMNITKIVDSPLSTLLLIAMLKANHAMIRNMKTLDIEPKELIGWENKLSTAISIREAINENSN